LFENENEMGCSNVFMMVSRLLFSCFLSFDLTHPSSPFLHHRVIIFGMKELLCKGDQEKVSKEYYKKKTKKKLFYFSA